MSQSLQERTDIGETSVVRQPRAQVLLNNKPLSWIEWDVELRAHFAADIWHVQIECWQQPENFGIEYWADATGAIIEIKGGFLLENQEVDEVPGVVVSVIIGQVDDVEIDPVQGTIELHGRSLAAKLIDTKTTNKWPNRTASQIATELAQEQGLTPDITPTKTPIGQYYNSAYADISRSISEWELLTFLAQKEGFECYVIGNTLYFGPMKKDPNPFAVWVRRDQFGNVASNTTRLSLKRSLTLAQDLTVSVITHDNWTNTQSKATASRRSRALGGTQHITPQTRQAYVLRRPGMTKEQAQQLASNTLADLTKFERTLEFTIEGNPLMTIQRQILFQNTETSFDQLYFVDRITQSMKFEHGYEMTVHAKNIPPTSTENLVQGTPAEINPPVVGP